MGLTLEGFNEILCKAIKDEYTEKDIIEAELNIIADITLEKTGQLLDELYQNGYKSKLFTEITNIKNNSEKLLDRLKELEEAEKNDLKQRP